MEGEAGERTGYVPTPLAVGRGRQSGILVNFKYRGTYPVQAMRGLSVDVSVQSVSQ